MQSKKTPIFGIEPCYTPRIWPRVEGLMQRVIKPETGYTLESVLTDLQLCRFNLWVIGEYVGAAITQIESRPTQRVLWLQFIAGDHMRDWLDDFIEFIEQYAQDNDCAAIEFSGRKGWNKIGERHPEYKPMWTTFRRELNGNGRQQRQN